jgi:hypothetical protein
MAGRYCQEINMGPPRLREEHTRLPLNSTQTAFFRLSVQTWPATAEVMVFGGMCRRPGPSLRGRVGCDGRDPGSSESPGRTKVSVAIIVCWREDFLELSSSRNVPSMRLVFSLAEKRGIDCLIGSCEFSPKPVVDKKVSRSRSRTENNKLLLSTTISTLL